MFKFSQRSLKKAAPILLSFLIPILIMTSYFAYRNMFPFGNSSLLTVDLGQQYVDFFKYYRENLGNWHQMIYSFSNGYGNSMLGTWSYYLMSPLNIVLLFFKASNLNIAILIITLLKYGLSGASFAYLIKKDKNIILRNAYVPIFSSVYALNGWMIANQLNIMWLDGMIFLPIIILGVNKIVEKNNCKTYIIALSLMIIINYYIGYMICIFSLLYFIYYFAIKLGNIQNKLKTVANFIISSIVSGMLSAWILIPTIFEIASSKGSYTINNIKWKFEYFPFDMLGKLFNGTFDFSQMPSGTPNIFVGCVVCIMFIAYFFSKNINLKNKVLTLTLTLILILSMCFEPLDLVWHAMQFPIWYPYRFSFIFCFWMIYIALISWSKTPSNLPVKLFYKISIIILVVLVYIGVNIKKFKYLSLEKYTISLLLVGITIIILIKLNKNSNLFKMLFILITLSDISANVFNSLNSISYVSNTDYTQYNKTVNENVSEIKNYNKGFYRIAKTFFRTKDDPLELNYYGGSTFNSMMSPSEQQFANNIGIPNTSGSVEYSNGTVVTDAILGYRYIIDDPDNNLKMAQKISKRYDLGLYKSEFLYKLQNLYNPYAVSLIFNANKQIISNKNQNNNPILYQNQMLNNIYGNNINIFKKIPFSKVKFNNIKNTDNDISNAILTKKNLLKNGNLRLYYTLPKNSINYLNFSQNMNQKSCEVKINNQNVIIPNNLQNNLVVSVPNTHKGYIDIDIKKSNNLFLQDFNLYSVNINKFKKVMSTIKSNEAHNLIINDDQIKANIKVKNNNLLATTIPYDKNWCLKVDGQSVKTIKWNDNFIAAKVAKGKHTIDFSYQNNKLLLSLIISMISLIITLIYYCIIKKRLK